MKIAHVIPLLSALLFLGCEKKIESQKPVSVQSPPIELGEIPDALAKDFSHLLGDRFIKIGKVSFDSKLNVYHAELFYKEDAKPMESRYVLEFAPGNREHQTNLTSYRAELPENIFGKLNQRYVYIDALLNKSKNDQQAGTGQPATSPESKLEGGDKPQPEAEGGTR